MAVVRSRITNYKGIKRSLLVTIVSTNFVAVQTTVTLTMYFIVYTHMQSFLNLCRNKKNNSIKICKVFTLKFLRRINAS